VKPGPAYPGDDQEHLAEPKHLKADDPGPNPRPDGCKCMWTAGSVGWFRGPHPKCTASH
jgi:hypothetical protein